MDWWVLELLWFAGMVFLALWLGPFIRRFGKSYAADVFRANPRTGKSFIVLMDVAYYLIFFAFILFTVHFEPDNGWAQTVNANQLRAVTVRLGGILLIVGILHGLNVLMLPMIGRILTLNRRLDDDTPPDQRALGTTESHAHAALDPDRNRRPRHRHRCDQCDHDGRIGSRRDRRSRGHLDDRRRRRRSRSRTRSSVG